MTEESREIRRTRILRTMLPLYDFIELTVSQLGEGAECSVPLSASNRNHVGIMHAGVLFALAEAAGGVAISVHREFARNAIIAKEVRITYRRPATTAVKARATVSAAAVASIRQGMLNDPKYAFDVTVSLVDEKERGVADALCTFVLRSPDAIRET